MTELEPRFEESGPVFREADLRACVSKPRRKTIEERLYDALGRNVCGNTSPPMDNRQYRYNFDGDDYSVFSQHEDGGTMWIGYANEWKFHVSLKRFRRIALWTIWQWAWADWFGLRTWAWYKLLRRKVRRNYAGMFR